MLIDIISDGREHQFGKAGQSSNWITKFLRRHADRLSVRKGRILDSARVNAVKSHEIECFFAVYEDFLQKYPIPPSQIYNCDETGVDPQGGTPKDVIAERGAKEVSIQRGANRESTSVLLSVSATGVVIPPLFIFKGEDLPSDYMYGTPNGSRTTVTPNAFIDCSTFDEWLDHFILHIPAARPILLILDNHVSHIGLPIRRKCLANGIHLLSFPPHTTHVLQPLDAGCFRSFKATWRNTIEAWTAEHSAANLPRHCRASVIGDALLESLDMKGISKSWRATGLWPVNRGKVLRKIKSVCTSETTLQSKYAKFVAVHDPLPVDQIDERGSNAYKTKTLTLLGFVHTASSTET